MWSNGCSECELFHLIYTLISVIREGKRRGQSIIYNCTLIINVISQLPRSKNTGAGRWNFTRLESLASSVVSPFSLSLSRPSFVEKSLWRTLLFTQSDIISVQQREVARGRQGQERTHDYVRKQRRCRCHCCCATSSGCWRPGGWRRQLRNVQWTVTRLQTTTNAGGRLSPCQPWTRTDQRHRHGVQSNKFCMRFLYEPKSIQSHWCIE